VIWVKIEICSNFNQLETRAAGEQPAVCVNRLCRLCALKHRILPINAAGADPMKLLG
jgi:hypothetical protein